MTELAKKVTGESIFLKWYKALTWNLMCYSDSTKNVKEGTHKRVPIHIYANAFNYALRPIGALAEYLSIFPAVLNDPC
eukprot:8830583-Ditylum_brightwellii.AAC.1